MKDTLPLLQAAGGASALSTPAVEKLMMTILASEDLANEPEFEAIIIDPMLCADTFAEVGQEMGIDPESLGELPEEEREEIQFQMSEESTRRLLTDELRQNILKGLNDLRIRLKQSGKQQEAARAAILQSLLSGEKSQEFWPMIGLPQAIVRKSLAVGFELFEASLEVLESGGRVEEGFSLVEKVRQSSVPQKMEALLKKIPGVRGFLEKQVDKIWEEGMQAIYTGDLYLELYSQEELGEAREIFAAAFGFDSAEQMAAEGLSSVEITKEVGETLISRLDSYITELFTSERLDRLRGRLIAVLKDPAYKGKWLSFAMMAREYMAEEDAVKNEKRFLIGTLLGEMRAIFKASRESDQ